jgi:non-ribosomal peptide synthetase component F
LCEVGRTREKWLMVTFFTAQLYFLGEELLPAVALEMTRYASPECKIYNFYGPAECTEAATYHLVTTEELTTTKTASIPVGRPIPNYQVYLLDKYLQPIVIGQVGEIVIGGQQIYSFLFSHN